MVTDMKRYGPFLVALLAFVLLLSACGPAYPEVSEPVADPAGQKFNTWGKYLPMTLRTKSGGTVEAAVKATVELDFEEKESVLNQMKTDEFHKVESYLSDNGSWTLDRMDLVRIRLFVMPWDGADFTADEVLFTAFATTYKDGDIFGGGTYFGPIYNQKPRDEPLKGDSIKACGIAGGLSVEAGDGIAPHQYLCSPMVLTERPEGNYFETVIFALLPKAEERKGAVDYTYIVAFTDYDIDKDFFEMTFADIPTEGKYVWEIPLEG